jgi:hypothetical protein
VAFIVIMASAEAGCVAPPALTDATNNAPFARSIPIHDVVQRVKCDLTTALYAKIYKSKDPIKFAWMRGWTAKADLTLEANESGGITPSFSYTQPLANAFITGLGPNSINTATGAATNVVSATAQSFSLGGSATLTGNATRTETLSFNLSMVELKDWKENRQKLIDKGEELTGIYSCDPTAPTDLQAGLDLNSWLEEALKPVELGDLQAGIHPTPSQAGPTPVSSPAPPAAGGANGTKALDERAFPIPTLSPEQKAFLDLWLANALTELEVPYDLDDRAYVEPRDPTKACTTDFKEPGKAVSFRPPAYPTSNQNSLVLQSSTNAQNAHSSAAEVVASDNLDDNIKRKAALAANSARIESLRVQKASQYAAQRLLAMCEADSRYIKPNKCISYIPPTGGADAKPPAFKVDLSSSAKVTQVNNEVTITARVSASGSETDLMGNVTFKEADAILGSQSLSAGIANLEYKFSKAGSHSITASFGSDGSTGTYVQEVTGTTNSTTVVTSTTNPSEVGKPTTFIATVTGTDGTPTGTVTFRNGGLVFGKKIALEGGKARYTTDSLATGDLAIVAEYGGDSTFRNSASGELPQKVLGGGNAPRQILLWSSANPSAGGQLVTFTTKVTGATGEPAPTGSVQFLQTTKSGDLEPLGNPVTLKNGEAIFPTASLLALPNEAASYPIVAIYSGDKHFKSANASLRQYVVKSISGAKYVVLQLSPYFCDGKNYRSELAMLARNQLTVAERNFDFTKQYAALAGKYLTPDPPFESIGQSLNFVVTAGASLSPNWSFARWKGPTNGGTLASVTGIRTHSLNIAMGPVSGTTEVSRVLDNAATRQAIQGLQQ